MKKSGHPSLPFKEVFVFLSLSLALCLYSPGSFAADKPAPAPKAGAAAPAPDEMMKAWIANGTPGPAHKALEALVGSWDVKTRAWMVPGAPPAEGTGTSENKMLLGGRYLEQRYDGTMMGGPFSGIGVTGYDNYKKRVVATWIDSMATGIMTTSGTFDAARKVITAWGTMDDPAARKTMKIKTVVTIVDADHFTYASWHAGADGKMTQDLDISYTRKK